MKRFVTVPLIWTCLSFLYSAPPEAAPEAAKEAQGSDAFIAVPEPSLADLPRELGRNFKALFSKNNVTPLLVGLSAAGVAAFFDHRIGQPPDGFSGLQKLAAGGDRMGHQKLLLPAMAGLLVAGSFSADERFHSMTLALAQGWVLNNTLTSGLKYAANRHRPNGENSLSFPSGHTSNAFMWATVVNRYYGPRMGVPAYATAVFIGFSRVAGGAHHMSDVFAGATLGYLIGRTVTGRETESGQDIVWLPYAGPNGYGVGVQITF